jgi:hypothetical protein
VAAIIQVERDVDVREAATGFSKPSLETRSICQIRRSPPTPFENTGGIENKSHYTRDVTFRADASRVQTNPGIIARLWSMAYNLPRSNRSETKPQDRFARKSDLTKATVNFRRMGWRFCSSDLGRREAKVFRAAGCLRGKSRSLANKESIGDDA